MNAARLVAGGFGLGRAPVAPGTVAALAAAMVGGLLLSQSWAALGLATLAATLVGLWATRGLAGSDPGWVVIDEIAGQWLAMLMLVRPGPVGVLASCALFRLFDIAKPGPVGWLDRQRASWAVMADDLAAGALAAAALWLLHRWLGFPLDR